MTQNGAFFKTSNPIQQTIHVCFDRSTSVFTCRKMRSCTTQNVAWFPLLQQATDLRSHLQTGVCVVATKESLWMEGHLSLAQFINPVNERLMIPAWAALALSLSRETLLTFAVRGSASPRTFSQIIDPTPPLPPPSAPPLGGLYA